MIMSSLGFLFPDSCERTSCPDDARCFKMSPGAKVFLTDSAKNPESNQIDFNAETIRK